MCVKQESGSVYGGSKLSVNNTGGKMAPHLGPISVDGKSPLTRGIKESNAGGTAAQKLDRLGIRAAVVFSNDSYMTMADLETSPLSCSSNALLISSRGYVWERIFSKGYLCLVRLKKSSAFFRVSLPYMTTTKMVLE